MQKHLQQWTTFSVWAMGAAASMAAPAYGQVVAAPDGTGTQVTSTEEGTLAISGGTQVGSNQFHSFESFSIEAGQTASFVSHTDNANIVGRVTGANPSHIDGTLQVQGSSANLYLVNPAGVMFGPNAQLSLSGSFTATTADRVGFEDDWLEVAQENPDYDSFTADPSALAFTSAQAGAIVNQADLAVSEGESLSLIGGSVVSTGDVSAPGGEISLVAVGGNSTVRLAAPGSLLSLEVDAAAWRDLASHSDTVASAALPAGLTGRSVDPSHQQAEVLTVNADGSVTLSGADINSGEVAVSGGVSTRSEQAGGTIALLGNTVTLTGAEVDASGSRGGIVRVGGDYRGSHHLPRASQTLFDADSVIRADGLAGAGGSVVVWADDKAVAQGKISATGTQSGGLIETSAPYLNTNGIRVDASGQTTAGTWLVDPVDMQIVSGAAGVNQVSASTIEAALNGGTNFSLSTSTGAGGDGDIALLTSINQTTASRANLTLTGRRFEDNGHKINLAGDGQLTFEINAVNPEGITKANSIGSAIAAIGNVNGRRLLSLGAGTYYFGSAIALNTDVDIEGASATNTIFTTSDANRLFDVSPAANVALRNVTLTTTGLSPLSLGGGIDNQGTLTIDNSRFVGNRALNGGAINSSENSTLIISNSEFANNVSTADGGGIYTLGNTTITDSVLNNNQGQNGGGIAVAQDGALVLENTILMANRATRNGAGLYLGNNAEAKVTGTLVTNADGFATASTSRFENNIAAEDGGGIAALDNTQLAVGGVLFQGNIAGDDGGGIAATFSSKTTVFDSNFENNRADGHGGGVYRNDVMTPVFSGHSATISDSRFIQNTAGLSGGGYFHGESSGSATIDNSLFQSNRSNSNVLGNGGGGIYVFADGLVRVTGSTFVNNRALDGGGLFNQGTSELINTTFSANIARSEGGAIKTFPRPAHLTIYNSTLSANQAGDIGGGIAAGSRTQAVTLLNTLVARNFSPIAADVSGRFDDQGNNLIGQVDGATGFDRSTRVGTAAAPLDPRLAPLANNGGPTKTHQLLAGSAAIDAGANDTLPPTDQRGFARVFGPAVDIGAVELTSADLPPAVTIDVVPGDVVPGGSIPDLLVPGASDNPQLQQILLGQFPFPTGEAENTNGREDRGDSASVARANVVPQSQVAGNSQAANVAVRKLERVFGQNFKDYWDLSSGPELSFDEVQVILRRAQAEYQVNSAVIYAMFVPENASAEERSADESSARRTAENILQIDPTPADDDRLHLSVVLPAGELMRYELPVTRREVTRQIKLLRSNVSDPEDEFGYRPLAAQLYGWLLEPLEEVLAAQNIQNLMYALDAGLRTAPIAVMRDPAGFALERFGISVVPSMGLMQADFPVSVRRSTVAMGVAEFDQEYPLPAVPLELAVVENFVPVSQTLLNEGTTLAALKAVQSLAQPGVLHLATHATFDAQTPEDSYIHLWDEPLSMAEFSRLDWSGADLELLILSACSTAMSSLNAELGFAGLAAAAGVDATVGSLWQVSDVGTLALMSEFYAQLESTELRFEALRRAQLALLNGETRIENGHLLTSRGEVVLPAEWNLPDNATLEHPFFWSAFAMVGNPW